MNLDSRWSPNVHELSLGGRGPRGVLSVEGGPWRIRIMSVRRRLALLRRRAGEQAEEMLLSQSLLATSGLSAPLSR